MTTVLCVMVILFQLTYPRTVLPSTSAVMDFPINPYVSLLLPPLFEAGSLIVSGPLHYRPHSQILRAVVIISGIR